MSDAAAAVAVPQANALERWLQFDAGRVDEVEAAYRDYIRHGRPGVWVLLGIVLGVIAAILATLFTYDPSHPAHSKTAVAVAAIVAVYGALVVPFILTPRSTRSLLLFGCCDPRRTFIFAFLASLAVTLVEYAAVVVLTLVHVPFPHPTYDLLTGGIVFASFLALVWAPVAEELLVQGWLQTRLLRLGSGWAGILATIFFLLIHAPKNPFEFVRSGVLALVAYLRATTRSLGACMLAHATNNLFFFGIYVIARLHSGH